MTELCTERDRMMSKINECQFNFVYLYYNAFNVYRRELAPGAVSLTGDRAQGDDSKHWAYSNISKSA